MGVARSVDVDDVDFTMRLLVQEAFDEVVADEAAATCNKD